MRWRLRSRMDLAAPRMLTVSSGLGAKTSTSTCQPVVSEVIFTIRVSVPKLGEATAEGTSKQEAETAAAAALLQQLQ